MESQDEPFDPTDDTKWQPMRAVFAKLGYMPPPADELDDYQIPGRLWELLYAFAGRNYFLIKTDHLSDRKLYIWLQSQLDIPCPDFPPRSGWSQIDAAQNSPGRAHAWLRSRSLTDDRDQWTQEFPDIKLPPRGLRPFDRDHQLPTPPLPRPTIELQPEHEDDPLELTEVDQYIHIENMKEEIQEMSDGDSFSMSSSDDIPPDVEEAFLEQVLEVEKESWQQPMEKLAETNDAPIPPDELTDETVSAMLWVLLHNLACRGFYCLNSNHLNDREVYTSLWTKGLREEAILPGRKIKSGGWFHDFIGSYGYAEMEIYHRFYADDAKRAQHQRDYPNDLMPPREKPPSQRDWRLPKGPF